MGLHSFFPASLSFMDANDIGCVYESIVYNKESPIPVFDSYFVASCGRLGSDIFNGGYFQLIEWILLLIYPYK